MKKKLKTIKYFLIYIVYYIITLEERNEYAISQIRGYKCIGSRDSSLFIKGSARTYTFDKSKPPERNYITWKEFCKLKGV